jgi:DNA ligase-1
VIELKIQNFATLYKKTRIGAIQQWDVCVSGFDNSADIITDFGQKNTHKPQQTVDVISKGKNIGKINETTPYEQAVLEATANWTNQKKKGYVESLDDALAGKTDKIIKGGVDPMLAHKYSDQSKKIKFPCYGQPKLDGIRCLAVIVDGKCTLWSRTRKPILSLPHIVKELEQLANGASVILDGELYNHDFKDRFDVIVSMVRQDEPHKNHEDVQYHIYDVVNDESFEDRFAESFLEVVGCPHVKIVETVKISDSGMVDSFLNKFLDDGYEGLMLRNADSKYKKGRSYDLQKMKIFEDAEFDIIGINEGRGNFQGHVGAFVCRMENGNEFQAKMSGERGRLKEYFEDHSLWEGKKLTVKFQGLTSTNNVPRFPVGMAIRDYE